MIVGLSICCFVLILWIVIWAFFAFTDDEDEEWGKICKIAMSAPTKVQKEKAEKLRKKFLKAHHLEDSIYVPTRPDGTVMGYEIVNVEDSEEE